MLTEADFAKSSSEANHVDARLGETLQMGADHRNAHKDLESSTESLKAVWIIDPTGPCLYKLVVDNRFLGFDQNLFATFFLGMQAFAECIGNEDAVRLDLKSISFSFHKGPRATVVAVTDRGVDVSQLLTKVSLAADEIISRAQTSAYNPFIPTDVLQLEGDLAPRIKRIVFETEVVE
jgi:hypothetical protein